MGVVGVSFVVIFSSNARFCVLLLFSNRVEERQSQGRVETRVPDVDRVHGSLPFSINGDERGLWGANRRSSACHSAHTLGPPGHDWRSTNDGIPREIIPHCNTWYYGDKALFRRRDLLQGALESLQTRLHSLHGRPKSLHCMKKIMESMILRLHRKQKSMRGKRKASGTGDFSWCAGDRS